MHVIEISDAVVNVPYFQYSAPLTNLLHQYTTSMIFLIEFLSGRQKIGGSIPAENKKYSL